MGNCASRSTRVTAFSAPSASQTSVNDLYVTRVAVHTDLKTPNSKLDPNDEHYDGRRDEPNEDASNETERSESPPLWSVSAQKHRTGHLKSKLPAIAPRVMNEYRRLPPPDARPQPTEIEASECRFNYDCDCGRCVVKHEELREMETALSWWHRCFGDRRPTSGPPPVRHVETQVNLLKGDSLKTIKKKEIKRNKKSKSEQATESTPQDTSEAIETFPPLPGIQPTTSGGHGPHYRPEVPLGHPSSVQSSGPSPPNVQRYQYPTTASFSNHRHPGVSASAFENHTTKAFQHPKLPPVATTTAAAASDSESRPSPAGRPRSARKHTPTMEPSGRPPTGNKRSSTHDSPQYMDLPAGGIHSEISRTRRSASKRMTCVSSDTSWPSSTSIDPYRASPGRRDDEWVLQDVSDLE